MRSWFNKVRLNILCSFFPFENTMLRLFCDYKIIYLITSVKSSNRLCLACGWSILFPPVRFNSLVKLKVKNVLSINPSEFNIASGSDSLIGLTVM